ncbi:hypothetical protein CYLTODRAFT_459092 [Cylindrobasidium torrendii FP15055 ss-10]|uniref:DUF659 domain-containing protein n=1 Tax=Cylindrobasidium torrendii FP15055 ss-10 TaxID=1314674 RepID=A0A0D7AVU9_9AGAR|nr:hypothetical protein CYLTODRAFT_459092 [Cylindrobasidium torrendii FP15055 ss-10]
MRSVPPAVKVDDNDKPQYLCYPCARCGDKQCQGLTTKDAGSTDQLLNHASSCYGKDVVEAVVATKDLEKAKAIVKKYGKSKVVKLTLMLKGAKAAVVTYSTIPPGKLNIRGIAPIWHAGCPRAAAHSSLSKTAVFSGLRRRDVLTPHYYMPHRTTVSQDVKTLFGASKDKLAEELKAHCGKLAFSTDCWTSPNHRPSVYMLDFIELARSHTGKNMATVFAAMLTKCGIEDKILSVTCNNVSNNTTMLEVLERILPGFGGTKYQVRCFAYTLNLTAEATLCQFELQKKKDGTLLEIDDLDDNGLAQLAEGLQIEDLEAALRNIEESLW